jgi:hypothetical protein
MQRALFRAITRWLIRSRRFRRGHLLVVMLAAVSSAEAPIEFWNPSPAVTSAGPTAPASNDSAAKGALPTSLIDDSPWPGPDLFIDSIRSESTLKEPEMAQLLAATNLGTLDFPFQHLIKPQTNDGETTPQVDPIPAPELAIDISTGGDGGASGVGNDFSFGSDGGTASNPGRSVISTPGTTVPEPSHLWLIAVCLLGLCRKRGNCSLPRR